MLLQRTRASKMFSENWLSKFPKTLVSIAWLIREARSIKPYPSMSVPLSLNSARIQTSEWLLWGKTRSIVIRLPKPNIFRSNILKNPIVLPGMNYIFAASLLFEYILSEYDYNLVFFTPRSVRSISESTKLSPFQNMISVGFPTRRISTDVFGYDSTKPETEQMLQRWMSHVSNVRHIHIRNIETPEQENRCAAIYEQYVRTKSVRW